MPRRSSGPGRPAMSAPSTSTRPELGEDRPFISFSKVVLPAPEPPTKATNRPLAMVSEVSASTVRPSYVLLTLSRTMASVMRAPSGGNQPFTTSER